MAFQPTDFFSFIIYYDKMYLSVYEKTKMQFMWCLFYIKISKN